MHRSPSLSHSDQYIDHSGSARIERLLQAAHIGTYALPTGTYSTGWYEAVKRRFVNPDDDGRVRVRHDASSGKSPSGSFSQKGLSQHLEVGEGCVARGRPFKAGTARWINAPASSSRGEYWADATVSRESQAATLTLESGVVEEVQFIGSFSRQMLTFVHNPVRPASRGVVICSPIMVELQVNQHRERELANRLAEQGMAVLRFHSVGEGNSDALDGGITLDTLVDDAAEATTWFTQATNVETLGFVGTRLGGVPAAATAAKLGAPIALWAPITNIDRYFSELSRIRSVARLIAGEASEGARSSMSEMLRQEGDIDVVGYSITKAFVESCHTTTIAGALRGIPVPVLLVALGAPPTVYDGLRDELTDAGSAVDVVVVEGNPSWWLQTVDDREVGDVNDKLLISSTVEWMADVLTPSAPVSRKHPSR